MGPGWTVSDGVWEHVPQNKRRKRDVPYPKYINYTYRAMSGLSSLQIAADAPISMTALDTSCDHTWKCLPKEIRQQLIIPPPNGPALWSLKDAVRADMYQKMSLQIYSDSTAKRYRFYEDLMKKQWVVWPIWVEDEWGMDYVTICWHALATAGAPKSFSRIAGFAIIDPRRHPNPNLKGKHITLNARSTRIEEQLRRFLVNGGYDVANMVRYDVRCSPMRIGEASSGERCFANVKELCSNICDWYYGGMNDERIVFTNLSRWVQPFQQRVEMTGINAWVLMASFEYNARLAVEALMPGERTEVTANGAKRLVYAYDLAAPFEEPAISAQDFLLTATPGFQAPKAAGANSNAPATPPGQGITCKTTL
ncbi:hypothetical protein F4810DRAFT_704563 [Camillea tinctor]|nr:hypothetical protein F4810DRAFT_704563 [Camillea tinctor]